MHKSIEISLVIPAFNEEKYIAYILSTIVETFNPGNNTYEIIVVNDGSTDQTAEAVLTVIKNSAASIRLINNPRNSGKGYSVKQGILASSGEYIFFTDADLPYDLAVIKTGVEFLRNGYDIVVGSRYEKGHAVQIKIPRIRLILSKAFRAMIHILIRTKAHDTQCGLKGFRRAVGQNIFKRTIINGFGFDAEVLFLADKFGYSVVNIPVKFINYRDESRVKLFKDSIKMLGDTLLIYYHYLTKQYDLVG